MRRRILLLGLACLAITGCQTPNQTNGAVAGGVMGGILGTGVGILARNPAAGALIGAGTGAVVGSAVGASQDKKEAKAAQAYAAAHPPLSLPDVVQMANSGVSDTVIIQQMDATHSAYNLTPADIQYLTQAHVSNNVIIAMQQRNGTVVVGPRPVYVVPAYPPPPPPVAVGVGVRF
jgi:hypothetical protein